MKSPTQSAQRSGLLHEFFHHYYLIKPHGLEIEFKLIKLHIFFLNIEHVNDWDSSYVLYKKVKTDAHDSTKLFYYLIIFFIKENKAVVHE
jgi:hypothetical protein